MFYFLRTKLRLELIVLLINGIYLHSVAAGMDNQEKTEMPAPGRVPVRADFSSKTAATITECPPLPKIEGGGYKCDDGCRFASTCRFVCAFGYRIVDECITHNKCIDDGDGDLMWNMAWGQCERICEPLPSIPNGKADKAAARNGEEVTYTCIPGFHPAPNSTMTQKCQNGKIDITKLNCIKQECKPPAEIFGGGYNPRNSSYADGDRIVYECNSILTSSGEDTYTCTNGNFTPPINFKCHTGCGRPVDVDGGDFAPAKKSYPHETVVYFNCDATHTLSGNRVYKCENGNFVPPIDTVCTEKQYNLEVTSSEVGFNEARKLCIDMGGDLIQNGLVKKRTYIDQILTFEDRWYWIGVTDRDVEGTFKYLNGSLFPTTTEGLLAHWQKPAGTRNGGMEENCVAMYKNSRNRTLEDQACGEKSLGICEIAIFSP